MTPDEIVWEITRRSWRFGVSVLMAPTATVKSGAVECGGYFCDAEKALAVAVGDRSEEAWLGVLLHEYCHLTQWVEGGPLWRGYRADMWDWLEGKRIKDPAAAVKSVQAVEEDCERRVIRLAQELEAPLDLEVYARSANAYIHFHNVMAEKRKWYRPDVVMVNMPDLLAAANPVLDTDFSKTSPELRRQLEALI